ncbi:DUF2934 domain-containing protein [Inquilinus sp. OTU3971]|uniref:DUF2934 domain-containing protein n=1 Tax=Inquilinus sp. OTU3971 TaxID=3043855 RepID=UPI00313D535F
MDDRIWLEEGCPSGREEAHWDMVRELVAIEDAQRDATRPQPGRDRGEEAIHSEPVEPIGAAESLGDLPGRTDQAERPDYPQRKGKRAR